MATQENLLFCYQQKLKPRTKTFVFIIYYYSVDAELTVKHKSSFLIILLVDLYENKLIFLKRKRYEKIYCNF